MACPAEDGLSIAHWHIKGLTKRGQKPFVTKGNRRTMTVAVFIKYGHRPVVVVLPPRPKQGGKSAADDGSSTRGSSAALTTDTYREIISKHILTGRKGATGGMYSTRTTEVNLLHDRHPAHTSKAFQSFVSANFITAELLPAKAPDLSPLDYGLFPYVKNAWRREVQAARLGWDAQCTRLVELLSQANVDSFIMSLPGRIAKCLESGGQHFE